MSFETLLENWVRRARDQVGAAWYPLAGDAVRRAGVPEHYQEIVRRGLVGGTSSRGFIESVRELERQALINGTAH